MAYCVENTTSITANVSALVDCHEYPASIAAESFAEESGVWALWKAVCIIVAVIMQVKSADRVTDCNANLVQGSKPGKEAGAEWRIHLPKDAFAVRA